MIKVMSFSSDVRTPQVFGWVSFIWVTTAVSLAVGLGVELQTISQVAARCGDNVTLTCDVSSSGHLDIKSFSWVARNKSGCSNEVGQTDPGVLCERTAQPPHRLTLTVLNVMPVDEGTYFCKLRSTIGVDSQKTVVIIQDCLGSNGSSINESYAECWFCGVYPRGTVYWSRGDVNLTGPASTQTEMDHHGRYNVLSTIAVEKGNLSQPYKCSLWIPSAGKHLSSQLLPLVEKLKSSGSVVKLPLICIMVEIMMVKFMT